MDFKEVVSRLFSKITKVRTGDRNIVTVALHHLNLYKFVTTTPIVHVTGSKGKGTTATFAATLLHRTCACDVGVYMSPHILTVRERIGFNGYEFVKEDAFVRAYKFCEVMLPPNILEALGYYETIFLMAMVIFGKQRRVRMMVIEVHLGGMYDVTNIFVNTVVVAITDVTMEHCDRLGDSVATILCNKLGIVRPKTRAVITTSNMLDNYGFIFRSQCFKAKLLYGDAVVSEISTNEMAKNRFLADPIIAQALSFAIYIDAIWRHCPPLSMDMVLQQIQQIVPLPARRQRFNFGDTADIFLDGAHTAESFAKTIEWFIEGCRRDSKRILIVTLTGERIISGFFDSIQHGKFNEVWFTSPVSSVCKYDEATPVCESSLQYEYARKCRDLTQHHFETFCTEIVSHPPCFFFESVQDAFDRLVSSTHNNNTKVLISGSLYLCAAVLEFLNKM